MYSTGHPLHQEWRSLCLASTGKGNVVFLIIAFCTRDLTVKESIKYVPGAYPTAIELISSGDINVKKLITNKFRFEESKVLILLNKDRIEGDA